MIPNGVLTPLPAGKRLPTWPDVARQAMSLCSQNFSLGD
jgi:hypothetical protein